MNDLTVPTLPAPAAEREAGGPATYNPCFDGIRAIAVMVVMLMHFGAPGFNGGAIGVDLFFVLSGYLITGTLLADPSGWSSLGRFYLRRWLRLMPALMLVCGALFAIRQTQPDPHQITQDIVASALYVANWTSAARIPAPMYLAHTWSLAVEEQFYLIWPFLLIFLIKFRRDTTLLCVLGLIIAVGCWRLGLLASGATFNRAYDAFDTRFDELLIGCGMALAGAGSATHGPGWRLYRAARNLWPLAAIVLVVLLQVPARSRSMAAGGFFAAAVAGAVLIAAVARPVAGLPGSVLRCRPLVATGRISYGLYLWHYPIALVLLHSLALPVVRLVPVALVLTFVCAAVSYRYVEQPLLKLRYRIPRRTAAVTGWTAASASVLGMAAGMGYFFTPEIVALVDSRPVAIVAYGPHEVTSGVAFNVQADGRSAIWIVASRPVQRDTHVKIAGTIPADTDVSGANVFVRFPADLVRTPGSVSVMLVGPGGRARSNEVFVVVRPADMPLSR